MCEHQLDRRRSGLDLVDRVDLHHGEGGAERRCAGAGGNKPEPPVKSDRFRKRNDGKIPETARCDGVANRLDQGGSQAAAPAWRVDEKSFHMGGRVADRQPRGKAKDAFLMLSDQHASCLEIRFRDAEGSGTCVHIVAVAGKGARCPAHQLVEHLIVVHAPGTNSGTHLSPAPQWPALASLRPALISCMVSTTFVREKSRL